MGRLNILPPLHTESRATAECGFVMFIVIFYIDNFKLPGELQKECYELPQIPECLHFGPLALSICKQ